MLLFPLSLIFGAVVRLRRAAFALGIARRERLPVPVIVVGNITVGGAGKTPLTCALAQHLQQRGLYPGIISRGYGGSNDAPRAVAVNDDPGIVGDEPPILAATGLPTWIGRDRAVDVD